MKMEEVIKGECFYYPPKVLLKNGSKRSLRPNVKHLDTCDFFVYEKETKSKGEEICLHCEFFRT
ncbi:MAG: hypothetical protein HOC71_13580 [Candidatus Latescibacteria bacterium]|nr:hypothetical protein [Candidatus Latescibacterota bacterium]